MNYPRRLIIGILTLLIGIGTNVLCLAAIDKLSPSFPSLPDPLIDHWPLVHFPAWAELGFVAILIVTVYIFIFRQRRDLPLLLVTLGIFYAARGIMQFFMPIGSPLGAAPVDARFVFYPYPSHAYFPGGHFGILTVFGLAIRNWRWQWLYFAMAGIFALGTMLAKTHYTADIIGGWLLAYAVHMIVKHRLSGWTN